MIGAEARGLSKRIGIDTRGFRPLNPVTFGRLAAPRTVASVRSADGHGVWGLQPQNQSFSDFTP